MSYVPSGVIDPATGAPTRFFTNSSGQQVSEQLYLAGFDPADTTVGGVLGLVISNTIGLNKTIPSASIANKVWIERLLILANVSVTLGTTATTYFTIATNTLRGCNTFNGVSTFALPTTFSSQNATNNGYVNYEAVINQLFSAKLDNWELAFTKNGVGTISMRINPVIEYRIAR